MAASVLLAKVLLIGIVAAGSAAAFAWWKEHAIEVLELRPGAFGPLSRTEEACDGFLILLGFVTIGCASAFACFGGLWLIAG